MHNICPDMDKMWSWYSKTNSFQYCQDSVASLHRGGKPKTLIQYRFWWNLVESIHNQQWLVSFSFHNVTFNLSLYFVPCNTPALQTSSDWLEKVTFLGSHLPNQGLKINLFEHCESIFFILTTSIRYRHITCILSSAFQQWFSFLTKSNCKKL